MDEKVHIDKPEVREKTNEYSLNIITCNTDMIMLMEFLLEYFKTP